MRVLVLLVILALPLGGCATIAAGAIGGALVLGAAGGAGSAIGDISAHALRDKYRRWKACHKIKEDVKRWQCEDRLRKELGQ